jgi:hypothetical protein
MQGKNHDEPVQIFVESGHKIAAYVKGAGYNHSSGASTKILGKGVRMLGRDGKPQPTGPHPRRVRVMTGDVLGLIRNRENLKQILPRIMGNYPTGNSTLDTANELSPSGIDKCFQLLRICRTQIIGNSPTGNSALDKAD